MIGLIATTQRVQQGAEEVTEAAHDIDLGRLRLPVGLVHAEGDHADVELRVPSIAKARELLSWEPRFDLEQGLSQTIDWYRHKLGSAR